jgi:hypothetical protein
MIGQPEQGRYPVEGMGRYPPPPGHADKLTPRPPPCTTINFLPARQTAHSTKDEQTAAPEMVARSESHQNQFAPNAE